MPAKWLADRITRRGLLSAAGLAGAGVALPRGTLSAEAAKPEASKTTASAQAKGALKCARLWPAVKCSFAPDQCIGAPRSAAGEGEIEENEAVERGKFAAVQ